jgi:hypothetical protein
MTSPQQAKTASDIPIYIAHSLDKKAYASLARLIGVGSGVVKRAIGEHLWRMGCVTLCEREGDSWFTAETFASPKFLGHQVYRHLKQTGRLTWQTIKGSE